MKPRRLFIGDKQFWSCLLQANLKQFMAAVRAHNVDSVSKFTTRGLDPNFQEHDTGGKCELHEWVRNCCTYQSVHYEVYSLCG